MAQPYHRRRNRPCVSAVIPAYNEALRIGSVLDVLLNTPVINEIIVVDDASRDQTADVVRRYPVQYVRLPRNRGKALAMEAGVRRARGDIIFFADADVRGLTPAIVRDIITPVMNDDVEMFIATRNRKVYLLSFLLVFLPVLGGERALRRELWERLPRFYKHRFRVEAGLNFFARWWGNDFSYKVYPGLTQTIKEKKYGLWRGVKQRAGMIIDVLTAQFALMRFHAPATVKYRRKLLIDMLWSASGMLMGTLLLAGIHFTSYRFARLFAYTYLDQDGFLSALADFSLQLTRTLGLELALALGALILLANSVVFGFSLYNVLPLLRDTYERRKATR